MSKKKPKSEYLSVHLGKELAKRCDAFPEVNWSEVSRKGIIKYLEKREQGA